MAYYTKEAPSDIKPKIECIIENSKNIYGFQSTHVFSEEYTYQKQSDQITIDSETKSYLQNVNRLRLFYEEVDIFSKIEFRILLERFNSTYASLNNINFDVLSVQLTWDESILYTILKQDTSHFLEEYLDDENYYLTSYKGEIPTSNLCDKIEVITNSIRNA